MSVSALMEAMAAAGAPMEAIILAVRALEAKDAEIAAYRYQPDVVPLLKGRARADMWATLAARDGLMCAYCGATPTQIDHIVPRSRGGTNDPRNLALACAPCNLDKSDLLIAEWRP